MFYLDWLKARYDSALLTYLKNMVLVLPVGILLAYLGKETEFRQNVFVRNKIMQKYRKKFLWVEAAEVTLLLALIACLFGMD